MFTSEHWGEFMIYNIDFDIAALFFLLALLFIFYYKKWIPNTQNKVFSAILWVSLFATITDILDAGMSSSSGLFPMDIHQIILYIYFLLIDALPILYVLYIFSLTGVEGKLFEGSRKYTFFGPIVMILFIILANFNTGWLFSYNSEIQNFDRNYAVAILNLIAFYYLMFGVKEIIKHRRVLGTEKSVALCLFVVFITLPIIIQMYMPHLFVTMFGVAICLFLIFMTIQGSEEIRSSTGLLNRNAFISCINIYNDKKEEYVIIAIRIRGYRYFKRVFGRTKMKKFLKEIGSSLDNYFENQNRAFYLGGGRFAVLLPSRYSSDYIIPDLQNIFNKEIDGEEMKINFASNFCIINCPSDVNDIDSLLQLIDKFDKHIDESKEITYASQIEMADSKRIDEIEKAVDRALLNDSFEVHFQPIYSLDKKNYHSAEALIRLHDEKLGSISPAEFIPIIERNGLIIQVGIIVLRKVCEFYLENKLNEKGIEFVEINLSVAQCMQKDFSEIMQKILSEYDINPNWINFEITETVAAESPELLSKLMTTLHAKGFQFSLDDYGTGYSSMISLIELPFHIVKLDREVVAKLSNVKTQIAIGNTIDMLKKMKMYVVAEGVETQEQVRLLQDMGCDYIQGFYYSKPLSGQLFIEYIQKQISVV